MNGSSMTLDLLTFQNSLDRLRSLFLDGLLSCSRIHNTTSVGSISTKASIAGQSPDYSLSGQVDTGSQHAKLKHHQWTEAVAEAFSAMDHVLRTIPALHHPDIHWSIAFQRVWKDDQTLMMPSYRISIMDAKLSTGFLKTSKTAGKKLADISQMLDGVGVAQPARLFEIADTTWPAASPEAAARIWAALHAPKMLSRGACSISLPDIRELHDRQALERSLCTPKP